MCYTLSIDTVELHRRASETLIYLLKVDKEELTSVFSLQS